MRYVSGMSVLETLGETETLCDTSFLMNVGIVRDIHVFLYTHTHTHTCVCFSLEISALLKLPVYLIEL